jgi:hypothetical protein
MFTSSVVDRGFISGVMVSVFALSVVDHVDIHILIAPLVSSNSSCHIMNYSNYLSMFISLQHDEGPPMFDSEQQFIFLRLNILREYLEKELLITNIPFEYDFEVNFSA